MLTSGAHTATSSLRSVTNVVTRLGKSIWRAATEVLLSHPKLLSDLLLFCCQMVLRMNVIMPRIHALVLPPLLSLKMIVYREKFEGLITDKLLEMSPIQGEICLRPDQN